MMLYVHVTSHHVHTHTHTHTQLTTLGLVCTCKYVALSTYIPSSVYISSGPLMDAVEEGRRE